MKTQIIRNNFQLNNNSLFDLFVGMSDWIHRPKKKKALFSVRSVHSSSPSNKWWAVIWSFKVFPNLNWGHIFLGEEWNVAGHWQSSQVGCELKRSRRAFQPVTGEHFITPCVFPNLVLLFWLGKVERQFPNILQGLLEEVGNKVASSLCGLSLRELAP